MQIRQVELSIRAPGQPERKMVLPRGSVVVGRADDVDVVLPDLGVSRKHARIEVQPGGVTVEDLNSGNGTWYAGRRVARQAVGDGEEVRIDPFVLGFRLEPEAAAPGMSLPARLEVVAGPELGRGSFPLPATGVATLGRAENNDVVLMEASASRVHAEIRGGAGQWVLKDRNSSNGTFVNGQRVSGECHLAENDRIRIGAIELRFTRTLAAVSEDDSDRTENLDAILAGGEAHGALRPAPTIVPQDPAARAVADRMAPTGTLSPDPAAARPPSPSPSIGALRPALPPPSSTREVLGQSRGTPVEARPTPTAEPVPARSTTTQPPAEPLQVTVTRTPMPDFRPSRVEPARTPAVEISTGGPLGRPRDDEPGFFAHPINQISLGVVLFALSLIGGQVLSMIATQVASAGLVPTTSLVAPSDPTPVAGEGDRGRAEQEPGSEPPTPEAERAVSATAPEVPSPPPPAAPSAAAVAAAAPATPAAPAEPGALASLRASFAPSGPEPTTEAGRLVHAGRQLFAEGRSMEAVAQFTRAAKADPANPEARYLTYVACEAIVVEQMRGLVLPPAAP